MGGGRLLLQSLFLKNTFVWNSCESLPRGAECNKDKDYTLQHRSVGLYEKDCTATSCLLWSLSEEQLEMHSPEIASGWIPLHSNPIDLVPS